MVKINFIINFIFLFFLIENVTAINASDSCINKDIRLKRKISYGVSGGLGMLIPGDSYGKQLVKSNGATFYNINLQYRALPNDTNAYDIAFGFPAIEAGLVLCDYSKVKLSKNNNGPFSHIGFITCVYGSFNRDLFNNSNWRIGYGMQNGVGICSKPYSTNNNYENLIIGSRWSVFFGANIYTGFKVTQQWEICFSAGFKHSSNSALDRPNKGANSIDFMAGIRFYPEDTNNDRENLSRSDISDNTRKRKYRLYFHERDYKKSFFFDIGVGWNLKTIMQEWMVNYYQLKPDNPRFRSSHYKIHSGISANIAAMYRYSRKFASGIGVDYLYTPYIDCIKEADNEWGSTGYEYNKHTVGIALKHNVYYKKMALNIGLGYYLKREMGALGVLLDKPYYETIGLKYYPPFFKIKIYIGYNVKAHLLSADSMQLNFGFEI